MKPLVIYHDSCADGFGAAFAAWLKLGDDAEYVPMQYGQVKNVAELNSILSSAGIPFGKGEVYILDFSLPKDVMDWLFNEVERVVWLDHHKTAFEMWCGKYTEGDEVQSDTCHVEPTNLPYIILSSSKSGAVLAWEYFHPGTEVPMFIKHIDDYDRWQFKIDGTKAFNKALWSYAPWSFTYWKEILNWQNLDNFYIEGEAILRAHNQNVASVVKNGTRFCTISVVANKPGLGFPWLSGREQRDDNADYEVYGFAVNCPPHLQSDVGHELATKSNTFGLLWTLDKDNVCKCSLRSNGEYDVSAIAKAFGGGGHRNAAGFTVDIQTLLEWIK